MAPLVLLAVIVGLLPTGLAGPACAKKYKSASDCMAMCNQKWGWMGMMMGTDPWGSVMHKETASDDAWNAYIANACGEEASATVSSTTSSAGVDATGLVKALGTQPAAVTTASSTTSTSSHVSSTSSAHLTSSSSSTRFTTSTTTSHTTSTTHTSTSTKPTTTSTKAQQTTTQALVKQTTTSTHTAAQATHTTSSNSGSSDSNSGSSDSGSSNISSGSSNSGSSNSNSGGSTDDGNGSNASAADVQAYLDAHNSVRSQHGAVPVTWSNAAASKAQEWADKCTNTHSGGTLGPLGENLAAGTGSFSIAQAVAAWANEVSQYNPNNPQPSHFTQMVWKATTQIGCAVQTCDGIFAGFGAAQYYVCEYSVQGNVIGNFAANVQA